MPSTRRKRVYVLQAVSDSNIAFLRLPAQPYTSFDKARGAAKKFADRVFARQEDQTSFHIAFTITVVRLNGAYSGSSIVAQHPLSMHYATTSVGS
jgi:hypothetical protein